MQMLRTMQGNCPTNYVTCASKRSLLCLRAYDLHLLRTQEPLRGKRRLWRAYARSRDMHTVHGRGDACMDVYGYAPFAVHMPRSVGACVQCSAYTWTVCFINCFALIAGARYAPGADVERGG